MVFAKRDASGKIIAISQTKNVEYPEELTITHPEIVAFISPDEAPNLAKKLLDKSDVDMVRVLEDLIEILINKNVIQFTELPATAQEKIIQRKQFRQLLSGIIAPDENINI